MRESTSARTGTTLKSIVCSLSPALLTSDVADSGAYTLELDPIKFTPPNGTPVNAGTGNLAVTIGQDTTGGAGQDYSFICWSTNGTTPTCACPTSGTGLTKTTGNSVNVPAASVTANTTIKAIGCDSGTSPVSGSNLLPSSGTATYPSASQMATPGITPAAAAQSDWVTVKLKNNDAAQAAFLCYTTDGSEPACTTGGATTCTASIAAGAESGNLTNLVQATNVTVKAKACDDAAPDVKTASVVASITYTLKVGSPTLCVKNEGACTETSPQPGSVPIGSTIEWRSATVAAPVTYYYTIDGSTPTCAGGGTTILDAGPLGGYHMVKPSGTTIKVIACSSQMAPSDVVSWTYSFYIKEGKIVPLNQHTGGIYNDYPFFNIDNGPTDTITLNDHPAYHIAYTNFFCVRTDGADPTCNATACGFGSQGFPTGGTWYWPDAPATIKMIACSNNGLPPSAVTTTTFVRQVGPLAWSPNTATTYTSPQTVSVSVNPPPSNAGPCLPNPPGGDDCGTYTLCTYVGAVSIPGQPNTCNGLKTYLDTASGKNWSCTTGLGKDPLPPTWDPTPPAESVSVGSLSSSTMVSAVACKEFMVWSTSQVNYTFNPYSHTIIIDGANDFNATNEAIATSLAGDTAYLSWDANNIYLGYKGYSPLSGETVDVYLGDGAQGTSTGDPLSPLPVNALYHLIWKNTSATTATVRKWTPGTPGSWGNDATVPVTVGWTGGSGYDYVEFSIARSSISGLGSTLAVFGGLLNPTSSAYVSIWPPTATQYYEVKLLASTVPNQSTIK